MNNNKRLEILFSLGLKFNGSEFFKDDINVHWTESATMDNNTFRRMVIQIKKELLRRKTIS